MRAEGVPDDGQSALGERSLRRPRIDVARVFQEESLPGDLDVRALRRQGAHEGFGGTTGGPQRGEESAGPPLGKHDLRGVLDAHAEVRDVCHVGKGQG